MNRSLINRIVRICQLVFLIQVVGVTVASTTEQGPERPNFLVLLMDDAGYTDLGCYGSRIKTPNMDELARQGMRFTDFYAAAPNCSPSRTGLMTGRVPSRVGMYSYIPPNHVMHLRTSEVTIANLLREAGYSTGHFGKWHLSNLDSEQPQPEDLGFEYSLGTDNNASPSHKDPVNFIRNGQPIGKVEGYSCQIVVDETINWLRKRQNEENPFFAYVCFHEPHTPIASPEDLIHEYQKRYPEIDLKTATYFANIANVDRAVGRLLKVLDELDNADDTFVLLTSDNGPLNSFSKGKLRERKAFVYEGGIREPGIVRWPGRVEPGSVSKQAVGFVDVLPTFCDISGIPVPRDRVIDGISFLPALRGEEIDRQTPLFWYFYRMSPTAAMRMGDWVIIGYLDEPEREKTHWLASADMPVIKEYGLTDFELYNLRDDISQKNDLAQSEPDRLEAMKNIFVKLHKDVVSEGPYWDIPEDYNNE